MARRITFDAFRRRIDSGRLTTNELEDYLEIDPTAPTIRVRLRPGTLKDSPPPGYDVDEALHKYEVSKEKRKIHVRIPCPRVVAEGDSWFHLPPIIRPKAIADRIKADGKFNVSNIARWGETLQEILARGKYIGEIKKFKPAWFIISAGGNDLQQALAQGTFVFPYDPARPLDQSVTQAGTVLLELIGSGYRTLLEQIAGNFPTLSVLGYGYDYPRPDVGGGQYIGQYLRAQGYPVERMRPLVEIILDRLNETIKKAVSGFAQAKYLSCIRVTDPYTWFDDMHPDSDGFQALATKFEAQMAQRARSRRQRTCHVRGTRAYRSITRR